MIRTILIFYALLCFFLPSPAQQTAVYKIEDFEFRRGMELLNDNKLAAAEEAFTLYLKTGKDPVKMADARYYQAYCAIQLKNRDGEALIESFIRDYPTNPKAVTAYFELGNMKYGQKQYKSAIRYFEKIYFPALPAGKADEAHFKLGYAYFTQKQFDKAYGQFETIKRTDNPYQFPASYYSGYINFQKGEYDRAFYDFSRAEKNEAYARVVPALLVRIYYKQHRYDELVSYAEKALATGNVSQKQDLYLFLGEAYYHLKEYEKASLNYQKYLEKSKGQPGREVLFRIADAEQRSDHVKKAIDHFKTVALKKDTLGYLSSYYLGNLYLETGNKKFAVTAYKIAKEGSYNPRVEEEAAFKYAKVNFDLGNYEEAIRALQAYKKKYPENQRDINTDELLTQAYLLTSNYDEALKYFDQMRNRTSVINRAYQKIAFYKGTLLFNDENYDGAILMFDKSLQYPLDKQFVIKANFWKGEAYSALGKYEDAINSYAIVFRDDPEGITEEYLMARYGIGYAYFNLKDYEKALGHFLYYTGRLRNRSNKLNYGDALVRLGDCYYATKKYQKAIEVFDEVISVYPRSADYAWYRKGIIYGILSNIEQSDACFDKVLTVYKDSPYYTDALFQKARYNFEQGNYDLSIKLFTRVIEKFPESRFVPYALLDRAIAYNNLRQYDLSARDYGMIIEKYPRHQVAKGALLGLQEVLAAAGRSDSFNGYLEIYKNANPESNELESIEFDAAKSLYFNQQYSEAVKAFDRFEKDFPESAFKTEAIYYRSDALYRSGDYAGALAGFYSIAGDNTFARHNRVLYRIAMLEFRQGNFEPAIAGARKLEKIAANEKEAYNAWKILMNAYYQLGRYDSADVYAKTIVDKGPGSVVAQSEALVLLGKTSLDRLQYDEAQDYFIQVINLASDERGAEAKYYLAFIEYKKGEYRKSLETLFDLNSKYGNYEKWLGKSFLLIADNYTAMKEYFQSKATLESLIDNSPDSEVVRQARERLKEVEALSAAKEKEIEKNVPDTLEINDPANKNKP